MMRRTSKIVRDILPLVPGGAALLAGEWFGVHGHFWGYFVANVGAGWLVGYLAGRYL